MTNPPEIRPAELPIVCVLGVGRSGTNFLADALAAEPTLLNCVENRYIWNYRQATLSHDSRPASDAHEDVARFIQNFFANQAQRSGKIPIDKTPSNVLRASFLKAVFPRARLIHLIRDGRSNVFSRLREWQGGNAVVEKQDTTGETHLRSDFRSAYTSRRWERVRDMFTSGNVPLSRIPTFVADNVKPFLSQIMSGKPVRYGERFPGMAQHLQAYGVTGTAAAQWREGVMHAVAAGRKMAPEDYIEIRYESLLTNPEETWQKIAAFLGTDPAGPGFRALKDSLRPNKAPDWTDPKYAAFLMEVEPHIRATNEFLGYKWT